MHLVLMDLSSSGILDLFATTAPSLLASLDESTATIFSYPFEIFLEPLATVLNFLVYILESFTMIISCSFSVQVSLLLKEQN